MKKPSDPPDDWDNMRDKIIGLGERSLRKSYYPELQRQLEAVQQSEERFRLLVEHTHDGILIIEGGAIQYANPRLSEILGETITTLSEDSMVAKLLASLDMASLAESDFLGDELWLTCPNGRKRFLNVRSFRLHLDELGDRFHVVVTDMTAQKMRETALEERVQERTAELQEANEKLKELDQLKNDFISNVSHDLRTPLTNIQLYSQLLELNKNPESRHVTGRCCIPRRPTWKCSSMICSRFLAWNTAVFPISGNGPTSTNCLATSCKPFRRESKASSLRCTLSLKEVCRFCCWIGTRFGRFLLICYPMRLPIRHSKDGFAFLVRPFPTMLCRPCA